MALISAMERAAAAAVNEPEAMAQNGPAMEEDAGQSDGKANANGDARRKTADDEGKVFRKSGKRDASGAPRWSECAPIRTMRIAAAR